MRLQEPQIKKSLWLQVSQRKLVLAFKLPDWLVLYKRSAVEKAREQRRRPMYRAIKDPINISELRKTRGTF
ncbi:hypothetical protein SRHO_G00234310 [Serrasalmus rhombeus]